MNSIPQDVAYRADPAITQIADFIADPVAAVDFPETRLRFRNDRAAASVGLAGLNDDKWILHFGRFTPLPENLPEPLALRYHGHQFRNYNPDIGDGRGFLFAQLRDRDGRLMDLATKGSGQTPYSRFGDGRLTLKGAVREILATEMLEALGVNTSKTFSVIETGEALHRGDEPSPTRSAVLVRLSHGHLRIGSFQRLATLGESENLTRLFDYALRHYYGQESGEDAPAHLLGHVVAQTAKLAASYMAAGFVHGVLNSDNINITGESFDYGPWRWVPNFDPRFTAAYFDEQGLYAFGRQGEAIHWDVTELARALLTVGREETLVDALNGFGPAYFAALSDAMLARLGVVPRGEEEDQALVKSAEQGLLETGISLDRFYFDWRGGMRRAVSPLESSYASDPFADFRGRIGAYLPTSALSHPYWQDAEPCSMLIEEVESIWAPIAAADDWSLLTAKVASVRRMGEAMQGR
jgi:serine/tyrosine/threonine adenylyltransferase